MMRTIEQIIENYSDYETIIDDRFGRRFCDFLTPEQAERIGWKVDTDGVKHSPKPWTKENILEQLKEDVEFGWEKACGERGISASLMFDVVLKWCRILEDGLEHWDENHYAPYGKPLFKAVATQYGWGLPED